MMAALRKYLIAGVVALTPLLVTVAIINWLLELSDKAVALLPPQYRPDLLLGIDFPGLGVVMALVFIILVGAVTSHFIGSSIIHMVDRLMERIPLVRTIHKATRQLLDALFSDTSKAFKEVVMVQFPQRGRWVIGFVTGEGKLPAHGGGDHYIAVFIPSTPLPTTGWLLFVEPSEIVPMDVSVEDGMKLVLSGGVLPLDASARTAAQGAQRGET